MEVLESPIHSSHDIPDNVENEVTSHRRAIRAAIKRGKRAKNNSDNEADQGQILPLSTLIQWEELDRSGQIYSPRFDHATARKRTKIYLFGGDTGKIYSNCQFVNDLYEYDLKSQIWRQIRVKSTSPAPRAGHSMIAHRQRLHIFGGIGISGKFDDFWSYDPYVNVWGRRALNGNVTPPPRSHHSAVLHNNCIVIFGGSACEGSGVVWQLEMLTKTWSILSGGDGIFSNRKLWMNIPIHQKEIESHKEPEVIPAKSPLEFPRPRAMHKAAIYRNQMYIYGGIFIDATASLDEITDEMWCFDLITSTWTKISYDRKDNWPTSRAGHAAVVVGHHWIINGGRTHQSETSSLPCLTTSIRSPLQKYSMNFTDISSIAETVVFESRSNSSTSFLLPIKYQIPLGDIWSFNFLTHQWKLHIAHLSIMSIQQDLSIASEEINFNIMCCRQSRWGHQLLVCAKTTGDAKSAVSQRVVVTGGVSLGTKFVGTLLTILIIFE